MRGKGETMKTTMTALGRGALMCALMLGLTGCPEDEPTTQPDTATGPEIATTTDVTVDATPTPDAQPDGVTDTGPDAVPDGVADVAAETVADGGTPDATPDVALETVGDGGTPDAVDAGGETTGDVPVNDVPVSDGGGTCVDDDVTFAADAVAASTTTTLTTDWASDYTDLYMCVANADDLYEDFIKFETTDAGPYAFTVTYAPNSACIDILVMTDPLDGNTVLGGTPDLSGSGTNSVELTLDAATTYYVNVYALDANEGCDVASTSVPAGPYALSVAQGVPCADDTQGVADPSDVGLVTLTDGVTETGLVLCSEQDEDYFAFVLPADGDLVVEVDHTADLTAEFDIYIYDSLDVLNVDPVDFMYDESGTGVNTLTTTLTAGTYYVNVYAYIGSGNYDLTVSAVVPECDPVCENGGVCVDTNVCDCTGTGFTGATCGEAITCTPVCENNGVCVATDTCDCAGTGFTGPTCSDAITCTPPCANNGVCVDTDTCDCAGTGFFGPTCEDAAPTVWINELHYDDNAGDDNEGVEIAGSAGTDLSGWSIVLYNGSSSVLGQYTTEPLTGTIPDQQGGYGTLWFPISGIQNGGDAASPAPDGLALVDAAGTVIAFLSYEGSFTASDGPAMDQTSTDIGVAEEGTTTDGFSLQLSGTGSAYTDFTWQAPATATPGAVNAGQTFQ